MVLAAHCIVFIGSGQTFHQPYFPFLSSIYLHLFQYNVSLFFITLFVSADNYWSQSSIRSHLVFLQQSPMSCFIYLPSHWLRFLCFTHAWLCVYICTHKITLQTPSWILQTIVSLCWFVHSDKYSNSQLCYSIHLQMHFVYKVHFKNTLCCPNLGLVVIFRLNDNIKVD